MEEDVDTGDVAMQDQMDAAAYDSIDTGDE